MIDSMTVQSTMTITKGTLDAGATPGIIVQGGWNQTLAGHFAPEVSTETFNGIIPQTINSNGGTFGGIVDSNTVAGGLTFSSSIMALTKPISSLQLPPQDSIAPPPYLQRHVQFHHFQFILDRRIDRRQTDIPALARQQQVVLKRRLHLYCVFGICQLIGRAARQIDLARDTSSVDGGGNLNWNFSGAIVGVKAA